MLKARVTSDRPGAETARTQAKVSLVFMLSTVVPADSEQHEILFSRTETLAEPETLPTYLHEF